MNEATLLSEKQRCDLESRVQLARLEDNQHEFSLPLSTGLVTSLQRWCPSILPLPTGTHSETESLWAPLPLGWSSDLLCSPECSKSDLLGYSMDSQAQVLRGVEASLPLLEAGHHMERLTHSDGKRDVKPSRQPSPAELPADAAARLSPGRR